MNFEKLLNEKKIEKIEKTNFDINQLEKDLEFSRKSLEFNNYGWVMAITYEIVLKASNKLMNFLGYRSIGKEHHKNTFEFMNEIDIDTGLITFFNKIRVKRNNFIYREADKVSKKEAEEIINKAEEFVRKIRTFVRKIRT